MNKQGLLCFFNQSDLKINYFWLDKRCFGTQFLSVASENGSEVTFDYQVVFVSHVSVTISYLSHCLTAETENHANDNPFLLKKKLYVWAQSVGWDAKIERTADDGMNWMSIFLLLFLW